VNSLKGPFTRALVSGQVQRLQAVGSRREGAEGLSAHQELKSQQLCPELLRPVKIGDGERYMVQPSCM